jgi:hypothetical protein
MDDADGDSELGLDGKPKRKQRKPKAKSKLLESFPAYMQEAFFGRELVDTAVTVSKNKSGPVTGKEISVNGGNVISKPASLANSLSPVAAGTSQVNGPINAAQSTAQETVELDEVDVDEDTLITPCLNEAKLDLSDVIIYR